MSTTPEAPRHTWLDDAQAFGTATVFIALGLSFLKKAGLVTGGVPGLAFLLTYGVQMPLGLALFLVNLPFCALAWFTLGARFTAKTLLAMGCLSVVVELVGTLYTLQAVHPMFAALAGGLLIGCGLLILFRHRASLGGVGVLALYLHRRLGVSAGAVQLAADALILLVSLLWVDARTVLWSLGSAVVLNLVLLWNHRPGRYAGGGL